MAKGLLSKQHKYKISIVALSTAPIWWTHGLLTSLIGYWYPETWPKCTLPSLYMRDAFLKMACKVISFTMNLVLHIKWGLCSKPHPPDPVFSLSNVSNINKKSNNLTLSLRLHQHVTIPLCAEDFEILRKNYSYYTDIMNK